MTTSADVATAPYEELAAALHGALIRPGNVGYDEARAVYNAMIDKRPAAIARCRDSADVVTCVRFGRDHGVEIAVRGGGRNAAGLGVWDDALVIDLSMLRSTTVDPENRTVRADAGCTWGDVDHATVAFGMATPRTTCSESTATSVPAAKWTAAQQGGTRNGRNQPRGHPRGNQGRQR